jgi:hypothetical protein
MLLHIATCILQGQSSPFHIKAHNPSHLGILTNYSYKQPTNIYNTLLCHITISIVFLPTLHENTWMLCCCHKFLLQ